MKDNNVPNSGMVNLYMLTFPTPLYFNKIAHNVKAAADMKPKYSKSIKLFGVKTISLPPPTKPIKINIMDPMNS